MKKMKKKKKKKKKNHKENNPPLPYISPCTVSNANLETTHPSHASGSSPKALPPTADAHMASTLQRIEKQREIA